MKKAISVLLSCLMSCLVAGAQGGDVNKTHIDNITVEARGTFHQETREGAYDSHFQGDYLNFIMTGQFTPKLTFKFRQRLNKDIEAKNPFKATDLLWLNWQPSPHWGFTFGKQGILVGGYEFDSAPIEVYYYSEFCNNMEQYYAFGASAHYMPAAGQTITLQFIPSPVSPATQDAYSYNLYWNGSIFPFWKTLWSVNLVEDGFKHRMNYIALGNKFDFGSFFVDVDWINRAAIGHQKDFFSDWTVIGKAIWSIGKWNLCTKVGYERNDAANVDDEGNSYDVVLKAGGDFFYYGAGVEFFPLADERLRLHAVYFRNNHSVVNNFDVGITWRMRIL